MHSTSPFHYPPPLPSSRSAAYHVGYLRSAFSNSPATSVFVEATRVSVMNTMGSSDPSGTIAINCSNTARQDLIIGPIRAEGFSEHFVALDSTVRASERDRPRRHHAGRLCRLPSGHMHRRRAYRLVLHFC
ncbi:hypothetical protein EI94DRAFT_1764710, partial [Lactarius quietus]